MGSGLHPMPPRCRSCASSTRAAPTPEPRIIKDFDAADISDQPFGWNLPNWLLRREMVARLAELPNVSFRPGIATTRLLTRDAEALVTLSDGSPRRRPAGHRRRWPQFHHARRRSASR